jgi:hypothetical protein
MQGNRLNSAAGFLKGLTKSREPIIAFSWLAMVYVSAQWLRCRRRDLPPLRPNGYGRATTVLVTRWQPFNLLSQSHMTMRR